MDAVSDNIHIYGAVESHNDRESSYGPGEKVDKVMDDGSRNRIYPLKVWKEPYPGNTYRYTTVVKHVAIITWSISSHE